MDCLSLEVMRSQDLRAGLALDSHFADAGHRLIPTNRT